MGRPKKGAEGSIPTKTRILNAAIDLFAKRGYDAVSIRDITRSLELNEASLYNHFPSKAALLDAAFAELSALVEPSFSPLPPGCFSAPGPFDLGSYLIQGALGPEGFFSRIDASKLRTWRILMTSQYGHEAARAEIKRSLLAAPRAFFINLLERLAEADRLRDGIDPKIWGEIIAAVFFEFSFESNLDVAWQGEVPTERTALIKAQLNSIAKQIMKKDL